MYLALLPTTASGCRLLVAAASDLAPLESGLKSALGPECEIRFTFASSGTLARQIRAGAEYDVFLAASHTFVADLVRDGKADATSVTPYARGRIALWGVKWEDLAAPRVKSVAIANPALAPYGLAARQALERRNLWKSVEPKLVYAENVRQTWQFARSGNVDAAIVSWSLAREDAARAWRIPAEWHDPIEQTGIIPKWARQQAEARRFLDWLRSSEGRKVLESGGLEPVASANRSAKP